MEMNKIIRIAGNPPRADNAHEYSNPGIRLGDSPVMLSAAKHLAAQRDRPFASLRVTVQAPMYRPLLVCQPSIGGRTGLSSYPGNRLTMIRIFLSTVQPV